MKMGQPVLKSQTEEAFVKKAFDRHLKGTVLRTSKGQRRELVIAELRLKQFQPSPLC